MEPYIPESYPPVEAPPEKKRNTGLIIAIVVIVLLVCCCCAALVAVGWFYGDQIMQMIGHNLPVRLGG